MTLNKTRTTTLAHSPQKNNPTSGAGSTRFARQFGFRCDHAMNNTKAAYQICAAQRDALILELEKVGQHPECTEAVWKAIVAAMSVALAAAKAKEKELRSADSPKTEPSPLASGSADRPTPTKADHELAHNIVYRVCNLPYRTYGEATDAIAQMLANARMGYSEPIPPPTFSKPNTKPSGA